MVFVAEDLRGCGIESDQHARPSQHAQTAAALLIGGGAAKDPAGHDPPRRILFAEAALLPMPC